MVILMKLCDFITHVFSRSTDSVDMVRVIDYKRGEMYDFYDDIAMYGNHVSEITVYEMSHRMELYYKYNVITTYCINKDLHIVVETF
jgi:hypothetical protein